MELNYRDKPLNVVQLYDDIDNSFYIVTFSDNDHVILYSNEFENKATVWTEASGNTTTRAREIGKLILECERRLLS